MKTQQILAACFVFMLSTVTHAAQYARAVDIPDSQFETLFPGTSRDMAEMMGQWPVVIKENIPATSEVAAPAYPNAPVTKLIGRKKTGPGKYTGLATVQMVTSDAFDMVQGFYARELAGWSKKTYSNGSSVYWAKTGSVENNSAAMKEPHVRVTDFSVLMGKGEWQKKLVPDAQTLIEVYYMPGN